MPQCPSTTRSKVIREEDSTFYSYCLFKSTKKLKACVFHISAVLLTVLSKEDGSFRLENMTAGTYTIRVSKELMFFEPITVKIAPNTPQLPDIITAGCVCFSASHLGFSFFRTAD